MSMLSDIRKARVRAENGIADPEPVRDFAVDVGTFDGAKAARMMSVREREVWRPRYDNMSVAGEQGERVLTTDAMQPTQRS